MTAWPGSLAFRSNGHCGLGLNKITGATQAITGYKKLYLKGKVTELHNSRNGNPHQQYKNSGLRNFIYDAIHIHVRIHIHVGIHIHIFIVLILRIQRERASRLVAPSKGERRNAKTVLSD